MSRRALFLDRDDTLIDDPGYLSNPDQIVLLPGVVEALSLARRARYELFLISNQSGVGRGLYSLEQAKICTAAMVRRIGLAEPLFKDICLATERPEDPPVYRKPSPKFLLEMISKHHLDPTQCWMVGDRITDIQAGLNAHISAALVRSKILPTDDDIRFLKAHDIPAFDSLLEAVSWICPRRTKI